MENKEMDGLEWVIAVLNDHKEEIQELEWGKELVVECPFCKDKMRINKSGYNGHVHMYCTNCHHYMGQ